MDFQGRTVSFRECTPLKWNMEPENETLEKEAPFAKLSFSGSKKTFGVEMVLFKPPKKN